MYNNLSTYESENLTEVVNGKSKNNLSFNKYTNMSKNKRLTGLWKDCIKIIQDNIEQSQFKTWFSPLKLLRFENNILVLKVPSKFFLEYIEENFYDLLKKTVSSRFGEDVRLEFEIVIEKGKGSLKDRSILVSGSDKSSNTVQTSLPFGADSEEDEVFSDNLSSEYTFDNFVVGDNNHFATNGALAVAKQPFKNRFAPLFVYGGSGLGKTHLLYAIGNYIKNQDDKLKIVYKRSDDFKNEFVEATLNNKTAKFMNYYRKLDVLLIDDIQFFAGKDKTQDNFFHIFNELYQAGKLIVLTSDTPFRDLKGIDERLKTRFQQGLWADIKEPDLETRMAILLMKAREQGTDMPYDVAEYIAENITDSIRELEGAIISIIATATFDNRTLDVKLAKSIIDQYKKPIEEKEKVLNLDLIKEIVSEHFGVSLDDMESKSRKHEIALARQISMFIAKKITRMSLKNIGVAFGGRDHSTVLHSIKTIDNYLTTDVSFKGEFESIFEKCNKYA